MLIMRVCWSACHSSAISPYWQQGGRSSLHLLVQPFPLGLQAEGATPSSVAAGVVSQLAGSALRAMTCYAARSWQWEPRLPPPLSIPCPLPSRGVAPTCSQASTALRALIHCSQAPACSRASLAKDPGRSQDLPPEPRTRAGE